MTYQKIIQIIWMFLVTAFLIILFFWVWSNSIFVFVHMYEHSQYDRIYKINKLTGEVKVLYGMGVKGSEKGWVYFNKSFEKKEKK